MVTRDTETILAEAANTLDFGQPIALMFLMTLQYVPDSDDPHAIVRKYIDALAPGSFLVLSDPIIEADDTVLAESARRMNEGMGGKTTQTRRSPNSPLEPLAFTLHTSRLPLFPLCRNVGAKSVQSPSYRPGADTRSRVAPTVALQEWWIAGAGNRTGVRR